MNNDNVVDKMKDEVIKIIREKKNDEHLNAYKSSKKSLSEAIINKLDKVMQDEDN